MIHGDVVTITSEGILIHHKALQPLGIFDQSICWAVWAANPYKGNQKDYPNLVISPIHPSSWPFLMRLEIAISDEEGALAWICGWLNENDLSILFLECTTHGFSHAFCNVIAESTRKDLKRLKKRKERFDKHHPFVRTEENDYKAAQRIADHITANMYSHSRDIEERLNNLAKKNRIDYGDRIHFLHSWDSEVKDDLFHYHRERVLNEMGNIEFRRLKEGNTKSEPRSREDHDKYIGKHFPKTATASYMQRLAYFSMYGGGIDVPFPLRYYANSALLKLEKNEIFSPDGIKIYRDPKDPFPLTPLPKSAISIFNSQDKYLRLKPLTSKVLLNRLTQLKVEYRIEEHEKSAAEASKGLMHLIARKLKDSKINLLHVSNKSTRYEYAIKAGSIYFIADARKSDYKAVEEAIRSINYAKPPELKSVSIRSVEIHEYPQRKLFVSLHFGHPREPDIRRIIDQVAQERGFEKTIVETYVAPATQTILEKIGGCQAFLQLLLFRVDDDPNRINFSWLDFEYGVASGQGLPSVRLVDTVRVPYDWWKNRITINPDQRVREFRSDAHEELLTATIQEAIEELAQELLRRQQELG